jgi:hypothetical protein
MRGKDLLNTGSPLGLHRAAKEEVLSSQWITSDIK